MSETLEGAAEWREILLGAAAHVAAASHMVRKYDPKHAVLTDEDEQTLTRACEVLERIADEITADALDAYGQGD